MYFRVYMSLIRSYRGQEIIGNDNFSPHIGIVLVPLCFIMSCVFQIIFCTDFCIVSNHPCHVGDILKVDTMRTVFLCKEVRHDFIVGHCIGIVYHNLVIEECEPIQTTLHIEDTHIIPSRSALVSSRYQWH